MTCPSLPELSWIHDRSVAAPAGLESAGSENMVSDCIPESMSYHVDTGTHCNSILLKWLVTNQLPIKMTSHQPIKIQFIFCR